MLRHFLHRHLEVALPLGLGAIERVQDALEVLRRRRNVRDDVVVEGDAADAVALLLREVGEARAEILPVLELRNAAAREIHRPRDVEDDREVRVRVGFVLLQVVAVGPRVQLPVHAADVVAGHVAPVLGEIDRRAEVRRAVQPVDESVDHGLREQLEIADAREDLRVDEPGAGE